MEENTGVTDDAQNNQSDEGGDSQPDPLKNLKSEFSRKFENLAQQQQQSNQQIEQLVAMLQASQGQRQDVSQQAAIANDPKVSDLLYENPDEAIRLIEEKVTRSAEAKISQRLSADQERQNTVAQLAAQYPEFQDPSSEAYKVAVKNYEKLPASLKDTAHGAKIAMLEAASEVGLVPKSKRGGKSAGDEFSLSAKGTGGGKSGGKGDDSGVAKETLAFAQIMGIDISKKENVEKLKNRAKRDFRKWS